ncbi:MAG: ABC transporter permease [Lentisphaerae bacterium]|nr:ABC transporter permease [Lentisphaerota bacterium]
MIDRLMRLSVVIRKDWLMLIRDKAGLAVLFVMPAVLVFVVSLVHDAAWHVTQTTSISMLIINEDSGVLSGEIVKKLHELGAFNINTLVNGSQPLPSQARALVRDGKFKVCVIIPSDFSRMFEQRSDHLYQNIMKGMSRAQSEESASGIEPKVEVILDPTVPMAFTENVLNALSRCILMTETQVLWDRISHEIRSQARRRWWRFGRESDKELSDRFPSIDFIRHEKYDGLLVGVATEYGGGQRGREIPTSTQHNVPAWTMFAMFFIAVPLSGHLIAERRSGTLTRLLIAPVGYGTFLMAKMAVYLVVCMGQFGLMMLMGLYVLPLFGMPSLEIGVNHAALLLVFSASALAAIGFGLLLGTVLQSQQQASTFGAVAVIIAAAAGGIMVPVFVMPVFLQKLSLLSPLAWGLNGALDVFIRDAGIGNVFPDIARLLAFFVVTILSSIVYRMFTVR